MSFHREFLRKHADEISKRKRGTSAVCARAPVLSLFLSLSLSLSLSLYQLPFISTSVSVPVNSRGLGRRGKANFDFPGHRRAVKNPMVELGGGKAFHEFSLLSDSLGLSHSLFIFEPRKF